MNTTDGNGGRTKRRLWRGARNAFTGKTAFWFVVGAYLVPGVVVLILGRPVGEAYVGPLLSEARTGAFNVVMTTFAWTYVVWITVSLGRCASRRQKVGLLLTPILLLIALAIVIPAYSDYTTRAKVQEGANFSNPARTVLGIACSEKALVPGIGHEELGLDDAALYQGTYTRSVEATVPEAGIGVATITFREILTSGEGWPIRIEKTALREGDTVAYVGTCGPGGMAWVIGPQSTAPKMYWPKTCWFEGRCSRSE